MILRRFYIIVDIEASLISNYGQLNETVPHEIMVSGMTGEGLVCSDFFHGRYSTQVVPFCEYEKAFEAKIKKRRRFFDIQLIRYYEQLDYGYNINRIIGYLARLLQQGNPNYYDGHDLSGALATSKRIICNGSVYESAHKMQMSSSFWCEFFGFSKRFFDTLEYDYHSETGKFFQTKEMKEQVVSCCQSAQICKNIILKCIMKNEELTEKERQLEIKHFNSILYNGKNYFTTLLEAMYILDPFMYGRDRIHGNMIK